jgi:hypothetical protein
LCYFPCPSHPPWLDHSNYVLSGVQVMKLLRAFYRWRKEIVWKSLVTSMVECESMSENLANIT